jgi:hypothetical protein
LAGEETDEDRRIKSERDTKMESPMKQEEQKMDIDEDDYSSAFFDDD